MQPLAARAAQPLRRGRRTRRVCFGPAAEDGAAPEGLSYFRLNLTVSVQVTGETGWQPACGDTLRVRFVSWHALFAPRLSELECGVHGLRFVLPPDARSYLPARAPRARCSRAASRAAAAQEVFIVHINGEGLSEPKVPRLFPQNLVTMMDGPMVYNLRVRGFEGRLAVAASYVRHGAGGGSWLESHAASRSSLPQHGRQRERPAALCESGEAPGRWVHLHSLYPDSLGETLAWRPYGCHWRRVTGAELHSCLSQAGPIKMVGESTLGELYEILLAHMNASSYYWPTRMAVEHARPAYAVPFMKAQSDHSEWHGFSTMLEHGAARREIEFLKPNVLVHMQVANDAARDTFAQFRARVAVYVEQLKAMYPAAAQLPRMLWITVGARHYKAGNGPGSASCAEGTVDSCRAVTSGTGYARVNDTIAWRNDRAAPPMFFGTLDRRRRFNAWVVDYFSKEFPGKVEVIDFESITARAREAGRAAAHTPGAGGAARRLQHRRGAHGVRLRQVAKSAQGALRLPQRGDADACHRALQRVVQQVRRGCALRWISPESAAARWPDGRGQCPWAAAAGGPLLVPRMLHCLPPLCRPHAYWLFYGGPHRGHAMGRWGQRATLAQNSALVVHASSS